MRKQLPHALTKLWRMRQIITVNCRPLKDNLFKLTTADYLIISLKPLDSRLNSEQQSRPHTRKIYLIYLVVSIRNATPPFKILWLKSRNRLKHNRKILLQSMEKIPKSIKTKWIYSHPVTKRILNL